MSIKLGVNCTHISFIEKEDIKKTYKDQRKIIYDELWKLYLLLFWKKKLNLFIELQEKKNQALKFRIRLF